MLSNYLKDSMERNKMMTGLNFQQNINERNNKQNIFDNSRLKIGKNKIINRLSMVSNDIIFTLLSGTRYFYKEVNNCDMI